MKLIDEMQSQHPLVRQAMYWLAVTTTLGIIGLFWFTSLEKQLYFASHPDEKERQQFVQERQARSPQPLAAIGKFFGSMTASIGSFIGFDSSKGFDRAGSSDHNHDAVHLLPLSK
jgi:hypothetical protein